jgi:uncharacterized protein YbjT (DUF2867 family)
MAPTVFVCGATGTQGGALVRALVPSGATIHALARDPSSPKAQALQSLGVELTHGDFDKEAALRSAIPVGTNAIFLNFMPDFTDFGANLRQAKLIMSIAKEVGVTHVVYSSGIGGGDIEAVLEGMDKNRQTNPLAAVLYAKIDIEEALKSAGFASYTILRPANFMANYHDPFVRFQVPGLAETGRSLGASPADAPIPMVSTRTIGAFSAAAILEPERFAGQDIAYADELVSLGQTVQKLKQITGKDLEYVVMSDDDIEAQKKANPFIGGMLLLPRLAKFVDIDAVNKWNIPRDSIDDYLQREKQVVLETYANLS